MSIQKGDTKITIVTGNGNRPVGSIYNKDAVPVRIDETKTGNEVILIPGAFYGFVIEQRMRKIEVKFIIDGIEINCLVFEPGRTYNPIRAGKDKKEFQVQVVQAGSSEAGNQNNGLVELQIYTQLSDNEAIDLLHTQLSNEDIKSFQESFKLSQLQLSRQDSFNFLLLLTKIKSSDVNLKEAYIQVLNSTVEYNRPLVFKDLLHQDNSNVKISVTLFEQMLNTLKDDISQDISVLIFNKFLSILPEKYNLCIIENLFNGELWEINELFFGKIPDGASPSFMLDAKKRMTEEIRKLQTRDSDNHHPFGNPFGFSDYEFDEPVYRSFGPPGGLDLNNYPIEVKTAFVTPDPGKEQVFHNVKNFLKKMTSIVKIKIRGEPSENEIENVPGISE
jgi:hypothetical protein